LSTTEVLLKDFSFHIATFITQLRATVFSAQTVGLNLLMKVATTSIALFLCLASICQDVHHCAYINDKCLKIITCDESLHDKYRILGIDSIVEWRFKLDSNFKTKDSSVVSTVKIDPQTGQVVSCKYNILYSYFHLVNYVYDDQGNLIDTHFDGSNFFVLDGMYVISPSEKQIYFSRDHPFRIDSVNVTFYGPTQRPNLFMGFEYLESDLVGKAIVRNGDESLVHSFKYYRKKD
jgi:hypothetical protein